MPSAVYPGGSAVTVPSVNPSAAMSAVASLNVSQRYSPTVDTDGVGDVKGPGVGLGVGVGVQASGSGSASARCRQHVVDGRPDLDLDADRGRGRCDGVDWD